VVATLAFAPAIVAGASPSAAPTTLAPSVEVTEPTLPHETSLASATTSTAEKSTPRADPAASEALRHKPRAVEGVVPHAHFHAQTGASFGNVLTTVNPRIARLGVRWSF